MKLFSYTLGLMASAFSPTVAMTANLQPQQEQKDKHPNVILIVADDLGYGDLSCYGAHRLQTPGMDRIVWGIERSGFFNDRGKWAKGFENQRV